METKQEFIEALRQSLDNQSFVKLTLSKSAGADKSFKNVYARLLEVKGNLHLGFILRYTTKDISKNYPFEEAIKNIDLWIGNDFLNADLFTLEKDWTLQFNKKRKARIFSKPPSHQEKPELQHDKQKRRWIEPKNNVYLQTLDVVNSKGEILKSRQKKFRQINKYIEIIDSILRQVQLPKDPHIVDMGSGKGYLTFALYDYLSQSQDLSPTITGIELRPNLVEFCNHLAQKANFSRLNFLAKDITDYHPDRIDLLIALHACDIATDIAIAKGILAKASAIIVAPCCHKQIRKQMDCQSDLQSILKHGILEERQAELITDGIRALIMEAHGYQTKVFEFISTEHTPKNLMIVGIKAKPNPNALAKVEAIKQQFGIDQHYLEQLVAPGV